MPWVKAKDSYSGKRHYVETVERVWSDEEEKESWRGGIVRKFFDVVTGDVCGWIPREYVRGQPYERGRLGYGGERDYGISKNGTPYDYTRGGASVKDKVNLMGNGVCTHCRAALVKRLEPALQEALKGLKA